jgi:hypothetical protein
VYRIHSSGLLLMGTCLIQKVVEEEEAEEEEEEENFSN